MSGTRRASLLVVLAHPDDEIFHGGVLAHLADRGVRVTLVCATDGEAGKPHPSVGPVENLGALRVEELRLSCARLGLEPPVLLRFHDSARKERQRRDDPHALANVDMLDVETALRGIIADVKPHVIVTFEPHTGGTIIPITWPFSAPRRPHSSQVAGSATKRPIVSSMRACSRMCSAASHVRVEVAESSTASIRMCSRRRRTWWRCRSTPRRTWTGSSSRSRRIVPRSA